MNKGSPEQYTLDGENYTLKRILDKSILIETVDGEDIFLPKSQLEKYNTNEIIMPAWLAKEKGFIS
ncbi:MAG: hypothetical protein A2W25_15085 [candidate division Zixibacteria bacterium RBG_16_53_22]|nr:MAG: hypothetical protein A2W25_15085 [candidate division Zixibacteria bacterium RBG_16_53_22]